MLLLASLIHPNLPRIYDYFVENHRWYFVMDFLAGETLEDYLIKRKYRPLPVEEVLDSGLQLSAVLDYLHIHQSSLDLNNISLRNIWRTPDGKLYLLDTGTTSSAPVMPARSSIYSLGKILRQLQTGKTSTPTPNMTPEPAIQYKQSPGLLMAGTLQAVAWKEPCRCGTPGYNRSNIDRDPEPGSMQAKHSMYHTLQRSHYNGLYYQGYNSFPQDPHLPVQIHRKRADLHPWIGQ